MNKGIIVIGPAASGKSTFLEEFVKNENLINFKLINPDSIVEDENHQYYNNPLSASKYIYNKLIPEIMENNQDFILDSTGANYNTIQKIVSNPNYEFKMIVICAYDVVCTNRNFNRDRKLPLQIVLENWYKVYSNIDKYTELLGIDNIYYQYNGTLGDEMELLLEYFFLNLDEKYEFIINKWGDCISSFQKGEKIYTEEELVKKEKKLKNILLDIKNWSTVNFTEYTPIEFTINEINKWITLEKK